MDWHKLGGFGFHLVTASVGIRREYQLDLVAHLAKSCQFFRVRAGGMRRVDESPMVAVCLGGKDRANLVGIAADGDYGFNRLLEKIIHVLGSVGGDINSDFLHHLDAQRMDIAGRI